MKHYLPTQLEVAKEGGIIGNRLTMTLTPNGTDYKESKKQNREVIGFNPRLFEGENSIAFNSQDPSSSPSYPREFPHDLTLEEEMEMVRELGLNAYVNPDGSFFFFKPGEEQAEEDYHLTAKEIVKSVGVALGAGALILGPTFHAGNVDQNDDGFSIDDYVGNNLYAAENNRQNINISQDVWNKLPQWHQEYIEKFQSHEIGVTYDSRGMAVLSKPTGSFEVSGTITYRGENGVEYSLVRFVDEADTTRYYEVLADSLGNYNIILPGAIGVEDEKGVSSLTSLVLLGVAPNPSTGQSVAGFYLPQSDNVIISQYNLLGQLINKQERHYEEGVNNVFFDGKNKYGEALAAGIYFVRIETGDQTRTGKMIYLGKGSSLEASTQVRVYKESDLERIIENIKRDPELSEKYLGKGARNQGNNYTVEVSNVTTSPFTQSGLAVNQSMSDVNFSMVFSQFDNIIYGSREFSGWDLLLHNPRIGNILRLTTFNETGGEWIVGYPTLDRKGNNIGFVSYKTGNGDLYIINEDTLIQLTNSPEAEDTPDFRPVNPPLITFSREEGEWNIFTIHPDGTNLTNLGVEGFTPRFVSSGDTTTYDSIAFNTEEGRTLESVPIPNKIMAMDGTGIRDLVVPDSLIVEEYFERYEMSPIDSSIVFAENADIIWRRLGMPDTSITQTHWEEYTPIFSQQTKAPP